MGDPQSQDGDRLARPQHQRVASTRPAASRSCTSAPTSCRWPCKARPSGAISVNNKQPYRLDLGGGSEERHKARRKLLEDLAAPDKEADKDNLLQFVARREVQTLSTLDRLTAVLRAATGRSTVLRPRWPLPQQRAAAEAAIDRPADPARVRHARLLRDDRRLRHALRPGPGARGLLAADGGRHLPDVPDAAAGRPRQARAGDDVLGVRPSRQGERQQGHRPRRRVVHVRGRPRRQGRRRRQASEPGRTSTTAT